MNVKSRAGYWSEWAAVFWLSLLCMQPVQAGDDFADVHKLPVSIQQVESLCPWKSPRAEGYIRVIRMRQAGHDSLYLQWLQKAGAGLPDEVISTRMVEELEQELTVQLEGPVALLHPDQCQLTLMAKAVTHERRYELILFLKGPGDYRLTVVETLPGDL